MMVDARGMRCPWPVVRLARALRETGAPVIIVADDPIAEQEIAVFGQATNRAITCVKTPIGPGWHVGAVTACLPSAPRIDQAEQE